MIEDRINKMVSRIWMYKTKNVVVEDVKITPTKISIILEKDVVQYDYKNAKDIFEDFLETSQIATTLIKNKKDQLPVCYMVSSELPKLSETIKDSIEKLKTDKNYINQANAINGQINSLLNLAKFELTVQRFSEK